MARLILLLAVITVIYMLFRRVQRVPVQQRRPEYIKLGLAIALGIMVILAATGRMHWLGAAFTALLVVARQSLPLLIRLFPMLAASMRSKSAAAGAHSSTVETSLLRMQLDHDSGDLQGEILKGSFKGWQLSAMDRQQLEEFLAYCSREDTDSQRLLDSYLQQRFPGETFSGREDNAGPASSHSMGRSEALAVLGLKEGATQEDILAAHRQLIQKLHPDRGGNDYLAAQINRARDVLL